MGLSRRMFTKEFKLVAVQRLERGSSIGEVARALEVNPNVLHRWRREIRQGPGNVFPGNGKQRWADGRIAELERKIGQQALLGRERVLVNYATAGSWAGVISEMKVFTKGENTWLFQRVPSSVELSPFITSILPRNRVLAPLVSVSLLHALTGRRPKLGIGIQTRHALSGRRRAFRRKGWVSPLTLHVLGSFSANFIREFI
jgi:transposase